MKLYRVPWWTAISLSFSACVGAVDVSSAAASTGSTTGDSATDAATCVPSATSCDGICNAVVSDGCGGSVACDALCGDGSFWIRCNEDTHRCECFNALTQSGGPTAAADCADVAGHTNPQYCGNAWGSDAPGCIKSDKASQLIVPLLCCDTASTYPYPGAP